MKYEALLFSASRKKDYRWLLVPQVFSKDHAQILLSIYNIYDKNKNVKTIRNSEISPLFLLTFRDAAYLFTCGQTDKSDEFGRKIHAMQGLYVSENALFEFRNEIPFILYESNKLLNIWSEFDEKEADSLSFSKSKTYTFEGKMDRYDLLRIYSEVEMLKPKNIFTNQPIIIPFNSIGFTQLIKYMTSPYVALPSFAFGAMPDMFEIYSRFKIIAPAYQVETDDY